MKKIMVLLVLVGALCFAGTAQAKHHKPAVVDPTFSCNGVTCTYAATGLAVSVLNADGTCNSTCYSAKFAFTGGNGLSQNVGYTLVPSLDGSLSVALPEPFLFGAGTLPGSMTVWLSNSTDWFAPAITGTKITVAVS